MRIFEIAWQSSKKRRRKQVGLDPRMAPVWHFQVILVAILAVSFLMPFQLLNGLGAAGDEANLGSGLKSVRLDARSAAEALSKTSRELAAEFSRTRKVAGINSFLQRRNSPLSGLGQVFVDAEGETGVAAELLAAITLAESSCATDGSLSRTNHNAWGMKGPQPQLGIPAQGGYCCWPDWPSAIHGAAHFIQHYWGSAGTAGELRGYACGSGSWVSTVEGARQTII